MDWKACELKEITFLKSNVLWGQGAHVGMDVKKAVHAEEGLYGMPDGMDGTILSGIGYGTTDVSWLDGGSGDKLTLRMHSSGSHISAITYAFEVYE